MSIPKIRHMMAGREVADSDTNPIPVSGGEITFVDEFPCLGLAVAASGRMDADVEERIAQASRAFGALHKAVFSDNNHKSETKRKIYQACILPVLLYGSECWIPLRKYISKLNIFHHRCIRTILGISNREQWLRHISMAEVRRRWGDDEIVAIKVTKLRLEWLGHIARMPDHRIPKSTLFSWFSQPRLSGGPIGEGGRM